MIDKPFKLEIPKIEWPEIKLESLKPQVSITQQYINALLGASGINESQAKTAFYYAASTHLVPYKVDLMPILLIIGPLGTGKSDLLMQITKMVKEPKLIGAETTATLRDELNQTTTALIDEGDKVEERYLQKRYERNTSLISYKVPKDTERGWSRVNANIFGATIICRRTPFGDQATKSRSITIRTKYSPGNYKLTEINKEGIVQLADKISLAVKTSQRVRNNWLPLQTIAKCFGDDSWLKFSEGEVNRDIQNMMATQSFEPEEAVLIALKEHMLKRIVETDVLVTALKNDLKYHFDLPLRSIQIQEICRDFGFKLVTTGNYPKVKSNRELLERLMKERGLQSN